MPSVLIRNLSEETHLALKRRAKAHGNSTEAELRDILTEAVKPKEEVGLGTEMAAIAKKYGGYKLEIKRDKTPARFPTFR